MYYEYNFKENEFKCLIDNQIIHIRHCQPLFSLKEILTNVKNSPD